MTENIRIFEIYDEMFKGDKDHKSPLYNYAKVRHTQYELQLWWPHPSNKDNCKRLPLDQVDSRARKHFEESYLNKGVAYKKKGVTDKKERVHLTDDYYNNNRDKVDKAMETLEFAKKACKKKCTKLVNELNEELAKYGMAPVKVDSFLDWLTFSYTTRIDDLGEVVTEPGYEFAIWDFHDEENRKLYYDEVKINNRKHQLLHPGVIGKIVELKKYAREI